MIAVSQARDGAARRLEEAHRIRVVEVRVGDWRVTLLLSGPIAHINEFNNRRDAYQ